MSEQNEREVFEYNDKKFYFKHGLKIAEPLEPFKALSIKTYEAYEKESVRHGWLIFSPVLAFIGGLILMVATNNYFDFSFVLWVTAIMYLIAMFTIIWGRDSAGQEIKRLKEYAVEKERKEAYEVWLYNNQER